MSSPTLCLHARGCQGWPGDLAVGAGIDVMDSVKKWIACRVVRQIAADGEQPASVRVHYRGLLDAERGE